MKSSTTPTAIVFSFNVYSMTQEEYKIAFKSHQFHPLPKESKRKWENCCSQALTIVRQMLPDPPGLEKPAKSDILQTLLLWSWRMTSKSRRWLWDRTYIYRLYIYRATYRWGKTPDPVLIMSPLLSEQCGTVSRVKSQPPASRDALTFLQMEKKKHRVVT